MVVASKHNILEYHRKLLVTVENLLFRNQMTEEEVALYFKHNVLPQHIHKSKANHWEAVHILIDALFWATSRNAGKPVKGGGAFSPQDAPPLFPLDSVTSMNGHQPVEAIPEQVHAPTKTHDDLLPEFAKGKVAPRPEPRPAQASS